MVPLFQTVAAELEDSYATTHNISVTTKYGDPVIPCTDMELDLIMASLQDLYRDGQLHENGLTVIVPSTVCGNYFLHVGDFARELDITALSCTLNDPFLTDPIRFPSVISAGPLNLPMFGHSFLSIMENFQWHSVAVLIDRMSTDTINALRYNQTCRYFLEALSGSNVQVQRINLDSDTTNSDVNGWHFALRLASDYTRIIVSCTTSIRQHRFLAVAEELGFANGQYAFIFPYSFLVPDDLPFTCGGMRSHNQSCDSVTVMSVQNPV
ncbi:uncharacterized protein LOC129581704 [Paramacrobiotus metropolitanus]|uniref:uncharacterized protein LOC129581704 n=1 Tax=Paramacrobiotus metropolitanus TaxID=2943436 RepID=UPI002445C1AB|nr:uncharacterized protein LOC129581704 [Paramacrobiotus metropolitanus]